MSKKKRSESTPILSDPKQSKIDLNQFINLTRRKDMRKILLMRLFYLKKLDFKQLLQTYENHIIPSPACYISGIQRELLLSECQGQHSKCPAEGRASSRAN